MAEKITVTGDWAILGDDYIRGEAIKLLKHYSRFYDRVDENDYDVYSVSLSGIGEEYKKPVSKRSYLPRYAEILSSLGVQRETDEGSGAVNFCHSVNYYPASEQVNFVLPYINFGKRYADEALEVMESWEKDNREKNDE